MPKPTREDSLAILSLLDEPVRRRLFDWVVKQDRPVGRAQAAQALRITRALAAFHLDKLAEAGLLAADYQRLSGKTGPGAGRPARVYWRADREVSVTVPERQYERVAQLFASALERVGEAPVPEPLRAAAADLGESLGAGESGPDTTRRLIAALEGGGYEPAIDESGTIRLRNCPFHALVEQHRPLVCGTNLAMAEGIARGVHATDVAPVLDPQPGFCCVAFVPQHHAGNSGR